MAWQQAGMADADSGLLAFGGLPLQPLLVPSNVHLHGNLLHWKIPSYGPNSRFVSPNGMLDDFIRINSYQGVLNFARTRGALWLCEHDLPRMHNNPWPPLADTEPCLHLGGELHEFGLGGYEPVEPWFYFVELMRAVLNVGAALQTSATPSDQDLERLINMPRELAGGRLQTTPLERNTTPEHALQVTCAFLMRIGDVSPMLRFDKGSPTISFFTDAFGALALQLIQALSRSQGLTICSSCGLPYARFGRKVQAGRRNYCPSCGQKAALRDAQRAYASRKSKEGR